MSFKVLDQLENLTSVWKWVEIENLTSWIILSDFFINISSHKKRSIYRRRHDFAIFGWIYQNINNFSTITLGNNFLLIECCLDFYNWFKVFLHSWIRKWDLFLSIRSGFFARLIWKKSDLLTKSITFLWHYQPIFVNTYHPKYVLREEVFCQQHILITVNWMVGIDKGKYT